MIDARNVFRKVTRTIYDFSPEQMKNLSAIVWLYRGQQGRYLALVREYFHQLCEAAAAIPAKLTEFDDTLKDLRTRFEQLVGGRRIRQADRFAQEGGPNRCRQRT